MAASSFKKISKHSAKQIPGTKPSFYNSQLLTSTGISSLDQYLGGGLPVGTVLLVEEEHGGTYAELILKYFLAEGVACSHSLFLGGIEKSPDHIIKNLPGLIREERGGVESPEQNDEPMKIAWRYRDLPSNKQVQGQSGCAHRFSLSQRMDPGLLKACAVTTQSLTSKEPLDCHFPVETLHPYEMLLKPLVGHVRNFSTEEQPQNLLRVAFSGLGSPICWRDQGTEPWVALARCLHTIKSLVRSAYAVCLITIPATIYSDFGVIHKLRRLVDFAVACEPFTNSEDHCNPAFRDYHGLFQIHQRTGINTIAQIGPETTDLVFSSKKKNFIIQKLHLPPDLTDMDPSSSNFYKSKSCGGDVCSNNLDF